MRVVRRRKNYLSESNRSKPPESSMLMGLNNRKKVCSRQGEWEVQYEMSNIEQGMSNDEGHDPLHTKNPTGTPAAPASRNRSKFII